MAGLGRMGMRCQICTEEGYQHTSDRGAARRRERRRKEGEGAEGPTMCRIIIPFGSYSRTAINCKATAASDHSRKTKKDYD